MRTLIIGSLVLAGLSGCATNQQVQAVAPASTVIEGTTLQAVIGKLADICSRQGLRIDETGSNNINCSKDGGMMSQVLLGTKYGSGVREKVRFNVFEVAAGKVRIAPQAWYENQTAFGQTQRTDVSVGQNSSVQYVLNTVYTELNKPAGAAK